MGLVICNKHGRQGFFEICEHIKMDLENGIYPKMIQFPIFNIKVCQSCYDSISANELPNMSLSDYILNPDNLDLDEVEELLCKKYKQINRFIVCRICDLEHKLEYTRKQGQEAPFEVFENTLTFMEKQTINQLENHLLENYDFEQSIVDPERKALFISEGDIAQPLLIKIYYITSLNKQNEVIKLIDDFFSRQKLSQRRLQFLEEESWIEEQKVGFKSYHRGEEKVIKDITIK